MAHAQTPNFVLRQKISPFQFILFYQLTYLISFFFMSIGKYPVQNMDISKQLEYLISLLDNPESNKGKILYSISSIYSPSMTQETIDVLNKSASLVMSADLVSILKSLYIEEYCALFASKCLLEIGDIKEDLLNGDVIKTSSIPVIVVNKLKQQVGIDAKQDIGGKLVEEAKVTKSESTKGQLKEYLEELFAADPQMSPEDALEKVKQTLANTELPQDDKIMKKITSFKSKKEKGTKKPKEPKEEKKKSKETKDKK